MNCAPMKITERKDGFILDTDATARATVDHVIATIGKVPLIVADPEYGNIVNESWDHTDLSQWDFARRMIRWTKEWSRALLPGGAFYVWGGAGKPRSRPFFLYMAEIEIHTELRMPTPITWSKKRGYGVKTNYLFTREECAYLVNGDPKKPRCFHIPLRDEKRGYAGFNAKYPAKSEFLRRTNVWHESEIFKGKLHECQKSDRVSEIPIEVHTNPGEWVIDLFAGSGSTSAAARRLSRKFVGIENGKAELEIIKKRIQ